MEKIKIRFRGSNVTDISLPKKTKYIWHYIKYQTLIDSWAKANNMVCGATFE